MRLIAPTTLWLLVWGCTPDPGESEPPEGDDTAATEDSEPTGETGETGETGDTDDDTQQPEDTAVEVLTVDVQRGDLVLWGRPAVEPGDEGYDLQAQIMFCEYAAEFAHVLEHFWGDVDTFNGSREPLEERYLWEQIEFVEEQATTEYRDGLEPLVLRPTATWIPDLDIDTMLARASTPIERYNQPILGLAIRWFQAVDIPMPWLWVDGGAERWAILFGIDLTTLPTISAMQYNPAEGTQDATDIASAGFWDRDADEASRAAWAVVQGWYQGGNSGLRDQLLDNPSGVAAVDAISLGQLAWWLDNAGLVDVLDRQPTASVSVRHELTEGWASSTWAYLPVELDLQAVTNGITGTSTIRLYCDTDTEPILEQEVDLPSTVELEAACSFTQAGRYHPRVEVGQSDNIVVQAHSTVAVVPETLSIQAGDFALWGYPALEQSDWRYEDEMYKGFFAVAASSAGVYDPYWGGPLGSYDGSSEPMGERYMWGNIDVVSQTGDYTLMEDTVVLRPTEKMHAVVDVAAMAEHELRDEHGYARPYLGNLVSWIHWGNTEIDWMSEQADLHERWNAVYGVDFDTIPAPQAVQWSPVYETQAHTDIADEEFWQRDENCSSRASWNMVWGAYALQGEKVREQLLDNWDAVAAIDSVTPGQLAWWLVDSGMAEVVLIASDPDYDPASTSD